jgi:hypothetical protein
MAAIWMRFAERAERQQPWPNCNSKSNSRSFGDLADC